MKAFIVVESMFGNSREVAEAVAAGMREAEAQVEVAEVTQAPEWLPRTSTSSSSAAPHTPSR